jgi:hypothetical protein
MTQERRKSASKIDPPRQKRETPPSKKKLGRLERDVGSGNDKQSENSTGERREYPQRCEKVSHEP